MVKHTAECQAAGAAWEAADAAWPNRCRWCSGAGEVTWMENLGPTGENWPCRMTEMCECLVAETCPRCGAAIAVDWTGFENDPEWKPICPECGWEKGWRMPAWDCYCWLPT